METYRHAASARLRRGLTSAQVAEALGVPGEVYTQWESNGTSPWRPSLLELTSLAGILTVPLAELLGAPPTTALDTLSPLWAEWGTAGPGQRAALTAVTTWAQVDDQITHRARPNSADRDSVAARGIPEARTSVFDECSLPLLPTSASPVSDTYVELAEHSRAQADLLADAWDVDPGHFDPWEVADTFGVPAALAPLGGAMFAATIRTGSGYAIVVNSDVGPTWRTRALTHALVHLSFGHPALGSWQPIPDQDDDSIYACTGWDHRVCGQLEHVTAWLTDPTSAEQNLADAGRPRPTAAHQLQQPGPVRAAGEVPGYWEQFDVHVRPVSLRRDLNLTHEAHLAPGAGESTWPPALVRRWVAATARGHELDLHAVRSFPFGSPGCPTVAQVETAIYQGKVVAAQLTAWNHAQFRGDNSR